jgi:hypothetical protein
MTISAVGSLSLLLPASFTADLGRDAADAVAGAGTTGFYSARTSQEARQTCRPIYQAMASALVSSLPGTSTIWDSYETFLERGSALASSPAQLIDKVRRYGDDRRRPPARPDPDQPAMAGAGLTSLAALCRRGRMERPAVRESSHEDRVRRR